MVPKNVHAPFMESCWKFQREGGLKNQIFKGKFEAKQGLPYVPLGMKMFKRSQTLNFQRVRGGGI